MKKWSIFKNLKSEKGLTGADVAVSLSIIATTIAVITMVYLNINNNNKSVDRTAGATRLATNILENIKSMEYEEIELDKDTNGDGILEPTVISGATIYNTKIPKGYTANISVRIPNSTNDIFGLVKEVKVDISFKVGGDNKKVSVNTAIERPVIPQCNLPQTSIEFLSNSNDQVNDTRSLLNKEIIPIKYSDLDKSYVITTEGDSEWYDYFSKEWAKILAFEADDADKTKKIVEINGVTKTVKEAMIDEFGKINTEKITITILKEDGTKEGEETKSYLDFLYVWIPNFGKTADVVEADGSITKGTYYFRYGADFKTTDKNAISFVKETINSKDLYYNKIDKNITFNEDLAVTALGYWRIYNKQPDEKSLYGILNSSQYGPQKMH